MSPQAAPFGAWPSPISAAMLTESAVALADPSATNGEIAWVERRPRENGRQVIVARDRSGHRRDVLPPPYSARTRVHEYGGRCAVRGDDRWYFTNDADQRIWAITDDGAGTPLTPEPPEPRNTRYADLALSSDGRALYAVRERHGARGVDNDLVRVDPSGQRALGVVASGRDFYAAPRPSPDGATLAYLCWDLPDMPWESTTLVLATLGPDGLAVGESTLDGGPGVSISQPRFALDGTLHYCSDRSGFWLVCGPEGRPLHADAADYCRPDWVFGQCSFAVLDDGRVFALRFELGGQRLGELRDGAFHPLALPYSEFGAVVADGDALLVLAGSPSEPTALVRLDPSSAAHELLARSRERPEGVAVSLPEHFTFAGGTGEATHAHYYPPTSATAAGEPDRLPPLVVMGHGGPTSQASITFDLHKQYFTSRGLGVVDVDYGGSSGYGRAYRERLAGRWGVLDVADCVAAARHLIAAGRVDPAGVVIRGGSAGGYTTLQALVTSELFAAGASLYGVGDLASLASDTHKFESRYLDRLVGPWPEASALYAERSPLLHADAIACPVIFFQGLEDAVVPPDQTERIVAALDANGVPVCFLSFAGEGHGFRRAETIELVARAELSFYGAVLGFEPDDALELPIVRADALRPRR